MDRRKRPRVTHRSWAGICALCALVMVVAACGEKDPVEPLANCEGLTAPAGPDDYSITLAQDGGGIVYPRPGVGIETNYDADLNILYLGPSNEGEDSDPLATLTVTFEDPSPDFQTQSGCAVLIRDATFATSDARRGTADELNGKYYQFEDAITKACQGASRLELTYLGQDAISAGHFCISFRQVFYSPVGLSYGSMAWVNGSFTVINDVF